MAKVQFTGNFIFPNGSPNSFGYLKLHLTRDCQIQSGGQIGRFSVVTVPLDVNGNVSGTVLIWPNDQLNPSGSQYWVRVFSQNGLLLSGPYLVTITSGGSQITPNTTIAAETGHNTSANSAYNQTNFAANFGTTTWVNTSGGTIAVDPTKTDKSLNPVSPGHVSHVSVKTLIPNFAGKWYAWAEPWFRSSAGSHINNGTDWSSSTYISSMLTDAQSRGFDGIVLDWYGTASYENSTSLIVKSQIASLSNFTYAIAINPGDGGVTTGYGTTAQLNAILTYVKNNYFGTPNYMTKGGLPVLFFWGVPVGGVDYAAAKAALGISMYWVNQGPGQLPNSWCDAVYDWVQPWSTGVPADRYNAAATNSFLSTTHSTAKGVLPAVSAGFNDKGLASWGTGRYIPRDSGKCWLSQASTVNANIPTNCIGILVPTWNDYEEGHETELGIENDIVVTASMVGSNLTWSVSGGTGDETTISSYEILATSNGTDAQIIATQATGGSKSVNIIGLVGSGTITLYVVAIGRGNIRTHSSSSVVYVVP